MVPYLPASLHPLLAEYKKVAGLVQICGFQQVAQREVKERQVRESEESRRRVWLGHY